MASFIVKQMVGDKVKGLVGDSGDSGASADPAAPEDPEVIQARIEAEEARKMKHIKAEQEREKMRQGIRDKYKLEKKPGGWEDFNFDGDQDAGAPAAPPDDSIAGMFDKAKTSLGGMLPEGVKGFLPFGGGMLPEGVKGFLPFGGGEKK